MSDIRKLPIGVQSFEDLRVKNFIYVDKTEYVSKLAAENKVFFLSRPRRFGKSLFLSTLKAYFLGKKELFKGLYIEDAEQKQAELEGREAWIKYPVLHLDFNGGIYDTSDGLLNRFLSFFNEYEEIYKSTGLDIPDRFKNLIKKIYETTGKQVVILVDEYDKPLLETMIINEPLNEEYRRILKGFYGVIKACDEYIRFAFLTGVTKFSKVSIFSDLNNLRDISMLPEYDAVCGITQKEMEKVFRPEIIELGKEQRLSETATLKKLKQKYDGYHFSESSINVYNPFSLLNVFAGKVFRSFWFATGTPTFLVRTLQHQKGICIRDILENAEMSENSLQDYRPDMNNPVPILFQSGYLTIKDYDKEFQLYKLGFPNDEVKYGFLDNLVPAYTSIAKDASGLFIGNFIRDLRDKKLDSFMKRMYTACAGLPYSLASKENIKMRERDYQIAFYIIFSLMGQFVQTEVVSSKGRADCVVHTDYTIYIFEFKLMGSGTPKEAVQQIKEKGYAEPYKTSGKKIVLIGAVFADDIDEDTADTWEVCELP
ncbi:ATP-binding protein [Treponema putidum]|uniref:AAA family ATPase n=1 Tax=Treponema putidum TaxID=221027 RepID=A0ABY5HT17_9SPIR|nr:ATP-binding protein [Treponema putidum]AIN94539.1 ATPase AAA [Treponema putidum]TWI78865.1 PD-(D/E)XK nuclease superfamily protein [Treponema putidum]UTY28549.1 AAA family ATPase [Treponema putidum]UTY30997.1 AAA family ATPase [Treponema putidum]